MILSCGCKHCYHEKMEGEGKKRKQSIFIISVEQEFLNCIVTRDIYKVLVGRNASGNMS